MALPKIQDLILYVNKVITGQDWNTNWQTVVSWFTSGNTDIKVKSIDVSATGGITNNGSFTQAGNVSIGGNLAVTGSVTGNNFVGDGSGLTGIVSAATVAYTPFAVNSGNVDSNGESDILYYTGGTGTLNFKVGGTLPAYDNLRATSAQGVTFELTQILDLDVSTYDDGTYTVCVKKNQTVAEVRGTVYRQIDEPTGNNGDLWLNTGIEGLVCNEKISGSWSNEYEGVPVGTFTVASGVITAVTTAEFNYNGYNVNSARTNRQMVIAWLPPDVSTAVSVLSTAVQTADINMWLYVRYSAQDDSTGATINMGASNPPTQEVFRASIMGAKTSISSWIFIPKGYYYQYSGVGLAVMTKYTCTGA